MKKTMLFSAAVALVNLSLAAADSTPKADLDAGLKKFAGATNYSWHQTMVVPEDSPFKPGPTEGKWEKDGYTWFTVSFGDNESKVVLKGDKGAATGMEGEWQSLTEMENAEGPARFMAGMLRNFKAPAVQAVELAGVTKEIKKDGDVYSGELTEEGAKNFLRFRGRRNGGEGPAVKDPKGSVKFWLKDGVLTKYEFNVKGTMNFNGNEFNQDRTTTVELKDVGTTKVTVPEEAKKKLS
jgi:hypothetical protein